MNIELHGVVVIFFESIELNEWTCRFQKPSFSDDFEMSQNERITQDTGCAEECVQETAKNHGNTVHDRPWPKVKANR